MNWLGRIGFSLIQVAAWRIYLRKSVLRREKRWQTWGLTILWWAADACFLLLCPGNMTLHSLTYAVMQGGILVGFIRTVYQYDLAESLFHMLIIMIATRYPDHAVGNIIIWGTPEHVLPIMDAARWDLTLATELAMLLVYGGTLAVMSWLIKPWLHRTMTKSRLFSLFLFTVMIIGINDFVVGRSGFDLYTSAEDMAALVMFELVCWFACVVLVAENERARLLAEKEAGLARMQLLMQEQSRQYEQKKQAAEQVERKYHDLKNHIAAVRQLQTGEKRQAYLDSLEQELKQYVPLCHTGNEALDVICNEKLKEAAEKNITLILMIEDGLLDFVAPIDIVTIFGNALDNALEATAALTAQSEREIMVRVFPMQKWAVLRFENPYGHEIKVENGNLQTTKIQGEEHGNGLGSIGNIVEKYHGSYSWQAQDGVFTLTIILGRDFIHETTLPQKGIEKLFTAF